MRPLHTLDAMRAALLTATLPAPTADLPALAAIDLGPFWRRFDGAAPAHLRAGLVTATLAFAALAPVAFRRPARLETLSTEEWETLFAHAQKLPLFADLIMLTKVVACLAYFDDDVVQDAVRAGGEA